MKCQFDEMSSWYSCKLMKVQVDEMSSWRNYWKTFPSYLYFGQFCGLYYEHIMMVNDDQKWQL
jgi:hypothetical protein